MSTQVNTVDNMMDHNSGVNKCKCTVARDFDTRATKVYIGTMQIILLKFVCTESALIRPCTRLHPQGKGGPEEALRRGVQKSTDEKCGTRRHSSL